MNPLILGEGLLGKELKTQTKWYSISRKTHNFDFADISTYSHHIINYDTIINCIGHTDTQDYTKEKHWDINYKGVADLVDFCNIHNKKLVHISTDYVYSNSIPKASEDDVPVHCGNWYGYTKLVSDAYVQLKAKDYLLIRCTHKAYPFKYPSALISQYGNFDYVDVIGKIIIDLVEYEAQGVYNVGTEIKTMYSLARQTKENVNACVGKFYEVMPNDISMDTNKLLQVLRKIYA